MTDRAAVPPSPVVTIEVDDDGRLTINGHDVPHDAADPRQVATDVVRTDFAQPLGRPVRVVASLPEEQTRMVVHPDGQVSDVEPHRPATPAGVPPATRAQGWLAARDAARVAAEATAARHAARRRPYPVVAGGIAAAAAGAAFVALVVSQGDPTTDGSTAAQLPNTAAADVPPAQSVIESTEIRPIAVSVVTARTTPGVLRLSVAAQRRTTARLVLTPLDGSAKPQRLALSLIDEADQVTVPDLAPGRYRWQLRVPGELSQTGVASVPAEPPPTVVTVPVTNVAPEQPSSGGRDDHTDRPETTGVSDGPNRPTDPDGD